MKFTGKRLFRGPICNGAAALSKGEKKRKREEKRGGKAPQLAFLARWGLRKKKGKKEGKGGETRVARQAAVFWVLRLSATGGGKRKQGAGWARFGHLAPPSDPMNRCCGAKKKKKHAGSPATTTQGKKK